MVPKPVRKKAKKAVAEKRRGTLTRNKANGKSSEVIGRGKLAFAYDEIERTGIGSDVRARRTDPFTGKKSPWKHYEIKS